MKEGKGGERSGEQAWKVRGREGGRGEFTRAGNEVGVRGVRGENEKENREERKKRGRGEEV